VKGFQRRYGLSQTGVVDAATREQMDYLDEYGYEESDEAIVPEPEQQQEPEYDLETGEGLTNTAPKGSLSYTIIASPYANLTTSSSNTDAFANPLLAMGDNV